MQLEGTCSEDSYIRVVLWVKLLRGKLLIKSLLFSLNKSYAHEIIYIDYANVLCHYASL
jgi:hypothetical protein